MAKMDSGFVSGRHGEIIALARACGFSGFGGDCFAAAIAINRVVFDGRGKLVAGLNEAFAEKQHFIGHMAVLDPSSTSASQVYWDADGRPKNIDEIESWGMLDVSDPDYVELAGSCGIDFNEDAAANVALFEFDGDREVFERIPGCQEKAKELEEVLMIAIGQLTKNTATAQQQELHRTRMRP